MSQQRLQAGGRRGDARGPSSQARRGRLQLNTFAAERTQNVVIIAVVPV